MNLNELNSGSFAGSSTTVVNNHECEGRYSFINFKASAVCFINPLTTGRYVGIMTTKQQFLQLCELEIYSRGMWSIRYVHARYSNDEFISWQQRNHFIAHKNFHLGINFH